MIDPSELEPLIQQLAALLHQLKALQEREKVSAQTTDASGAPVPRYRRV